MKDPKPKTPRNEDFKAHVREGKCDICGVNPAQHAHHLESGVMGSKGSDYSCIGPCPSCHRLIHDKGLAHVEDRFNVSAWRQNSRQLRSYFVQS